MHPRDHISFILVRTRFASNLGSSVRAMKNMGFERLVLVQPQCEVGMEARTYALKGDSVLDEAAYFPSLREAARRQTLLIGTTARFAGKGPRNLISLPQLAEHLLPGSGPVSTALVFGSEDNGLQREELELCQWLVEIPTASEFGVMNLAQAVAVVAYELNRDVPPQSSGGLFREAAPEAVQSLVEHVRQTLDGLSLPPAVSVLRLMNRLKRLVSRARLEPEDVNLLHSLLSAIDKKEN